MGTNLFQELFPVSSRTRLVVVMVVCTALTFISSSPQAFNVYSSALKVSFNYTQHEVELISSLLFIGAAATLPAGLVFDAKGPLWTLSLATLIATGGWLLVWSATQLVNFYKTKYYLLAIIFMIAGHGRTYGFMAGLVHAVKQVAAKHRAVVIVLLDSIYTLGILTFAFTYENSFVQGHENDPENQNMPGFFIFVVSITGSIYAIGFLVIWWTDKEVETTEYVSLHEESKKVLEMQMNGKNENAKLYPNGLSNYQAVYLTPQTSGDEATELIRNGDVEKQNSTKNAGEGTKEYLDKDQDVYMESSGHTTDVSTDGEGNENSIEECKPKSRNRCRPSEDGWCRTVFITPEYQFNLWITTFVSGICYFMAFNLRYITNSAGATDEDYGLIIANRISVFVGRLGFGLPIALIPRILALPEILLLTVSVLVLLTQLLLLAIGQTVETLWFCFVTVGLCQGAAVVLGRLLVNKYFGMKFYGRNIGIVKTTEPFAVLILQTIYGLSYEAAIGDEGTIYCFSDTCMNVILGVNVGVMIFSTILAAWLLYRNYNVERKEQ